jgi:hypothetical protein
MCSTAAGHTCGGYVLLRSLPSWKGVMCNSRSCSSVAGWESGAAQVAQIGSRGQLGWVGKWS